MSAEIVDKVRSRISPTARGGIYYAVNFAVISIFFSYTSIAFIEKGLTGVQLGTFSSIGSLITLIAAPLLTSLADRKGWHIDMLALSNFLYGFIVLAMGAAPGFVGLLPLIMVGSFLRSPVGSLMDGLIVRMANNFRIDFGRMRAWGSVSFAVFCSLAGWLWDVIGLRWLFVVGGALSFLRVLVDLLLEPVKKSASQTIPEPPSDPDPNPAQPGKRQWLKPLQDRIFLVYLIGIVLWGCAMNGFFGYISIYMNQLSQSTLLVGIMMAIPALTEMPSMFLAEKLTRRYGPLPILIFGMVIFVMVSFAVAFTHSPLILIILNAIRGLGFGFYIVVGVRFVDSRAPQDQMGTYQSLSTIALYTIPALFFMPILGYIYDYVNINTTFLVSGGMGILTILVLTALQRHLRREMQTAEITVKT